MDLIPINKIRPNSGNPRLIKDEAFAKLVKSISSFPEMLVVRPIVVNKDMIVLGGNMRFKAAIEAGLKEVPVDIVDWSEEKQKEFIIKDNISGGEFDWDVLANEWDTVQLEDWGLKMFETSLDDLDYHSDHPPKAGFSRIVLDYSDEDYEKVMTALATYPDKKEDVVKQLLGI